MTADDANTHPSNDEEDTATRDDESVDDSHAACSMCIAPVDPSAVPAATAVALVGYGRLEYGELVQLGEVVVDAYAMILPDGRAVSYTDDPHGNGDPGARVWPRVEDAARFWGSYVLWAPTG